jgi:cell division protein ZapA
MDRFCPTKTERSLVLIMNKVKVTILAKDYTLQTPEDEKYVIGLAKALDRDVRAIMKNDPTLSITSACILAALDAYDTRSKIETEADNLRFQLKDYINDAVKANARADELQKQVQQMERQIKDLQNDIELNNLQKKLEDATEE